MQMPLWAVAVRMAAGCRASWPEKVRCHARPIRQLAPICKTNFAYQGVEALVCRAPRLLCGPVIPIFCGLGLQATGGFTRQPCPVAAARALADPVALWDSGALAAARRGRGAEM